MCSWWMPGLLAVLLAVPGVCAARTPMPGQAEVLDDSGTYVPGGLMLLSWQDVVPGSRADLQSLQGQVPVELRLNTAAWQGRNARIYMVLDPQADGTVTVSWAAAGPLREGRLSNGQRVLVLAGTVPGPRIETRLLLHVRTSGSWGADRRRLRFHFEIETD